MLSGCEWLGPESGDSGGAEERLELTAGYTAPAQWPLVIRQPKADQENCWSPMSHGLRWVGEFLFSLVQLRLHGWLDPSSTPDLDLNVHASCFPNKGNTDMHSRWEVRVGDLAHHRQNSICVSGCYGFTDTAGWEIKIGTFQGFCLLEGFCLLSPSSVTHTSWHDFDAQGKGHAAPLSMHKLLRNYENRGHQVSLPRSKCHG